jgi:hypothetical protein
MIKVFLSRQREKGRGRSRDKRNRVERHQWGRNGIGRVEMAGGHDVDSEFAELQRGSIIIMIE